MKGSQPSSGRIRLEYLQDSTQNPDRKDYRLTSTFRWDDRQALDCFDKGFVDWAYEHEILYGDWFDRKIWNEDFSDLPADAGAYLDTTASDRGDKTTLAFGIFRPENLAAGRDYTVTFELFLPADPPGGVLPLTLEGEVVEKQCGDVDPWCVGLPGADRNRETFVGESRGFAPTGDCWDWWYPGSPRNCQAPAPQPTPAPTPETTPQPTPAPTPNPEPELEPVPTPDPPQVPTPQPAPDPSPSPQPSIRTIGHFQVPTQLNAFVFAEVTNETSYSAGALYRGPAYPDEYFYLDLGDGSFEEIYGPHGYRADTTVDRISCDRSDQALPNSNARYVTCWYSDPAGWYIKGQEPAPNGDMAHTAGLLDAAIRGGAGPT